MYGAATRALSFNFVKGNGNGNGTNFIGEWPRSHVNTVLNICPQGEVMVVERLGKMHKIHEGGWFFAIPLIDEVKYVIDMRERAVSVNPQSCITKDNVSVTVSGTLYIQFMDAYKAAYGCENPLYAVTQYAQSSMRAAIGELELDQILHARAQLNSVIREAIQEASVSWGLDIKRYEITDVTPDLHITEAMDKQAAAERERRKKVLEAEGSKRSVELESEGQKIRFINESEGRMVQVRNEAIATRDKLLLEAEGEAEAIRRKAQAQSDAIALIAKSLDACDNAEQAAKLNIARELISMYGEIGQKSNTMIFSDRPADINHVLAQASAVIQALPQQGQRSIGDGKKE